MPVYITRGLTDILEDNINILQESKNVGDTNKPFKTIHSGQFYISLIINIVWVYFAWKLFPYIIFLGQQRAYDAIQEQKQFIIYYLLIGLVFSIFYLSRRALLYLSVAGMSSIFVWIILFYNVFYSNLYTNYSQVNNCQVYEIDQFYVPEGLNFKEKYQVLSVKFEMQNTIYQGYACQSSYKYKNVLLESPKVYDFVKKGDLITTSENQYNLGRFIDVKYNSTEVKIPAWQCIDIKKQLQPEYSNCYVNIYGDENKAKQNGLNKTMSVKNMKDFYLVNLENSIPYYNKEMFEQIYFFSYFPFYFVGLILISHLVIKNYQQTTQILLKISINNCKIQRFLEVEKIYTSWAIKLILENKKEDQQQIISLLNQAICINPKYYKAYLFKGIALYNQKKIFEMYQCFYIAQSLNQSKKQLKFIQNPAIRKFAMLYYIQRQSQLNSIKLLDQQYQKLYRQDIIKEVAQYLYIDTPCKQNNTQIYIENQL